MDSKVRPAYIFNAVKVLLVVAGLIYLYSEARTGGDFTAFLAAGDALYHHLNCYNTWFTYQGIHVGVQYSYSPVFALLLAPFSQMPVLVIEFAFLLCYPFIIWRIWRLVTIQLSIEVFSRNEKMLWGILLGASTARFFLHNIEMIQVNLLLLYLSMEGLYQIQQRNRKLTGSVLMALGCVVKILPVAFIPYLIYRREFKAASLVIFALMLMMLLPVPFLGLPFTEQLYHDWWGVINPAKPEYTYLSYLYEGQGVQSLAAFVAVFFSSGSHDGLSVSLLRLSPEKLNILLFCLQAFFVLLTFWFLGTYPFKSSENKISAFYEQAYIFLVTPLLFPHQQKYAFVYIFPAYAFIFTWVILRRKNGMRVSRFFYFLLILAFCLLTLTTDGLIGWKLSLALQYMKSITFGTFILILLLGMCDRNLKIHPSMP